MDNKCAKKSGAEWPLAGRRHLGDAGDLLVVAVHEVAVGDGPLLRHQRQRRQKVVVRVVVVLGPRLVRDLVLRSLLISTLRKLLLWLSFRDICPRVVSTDKIFVCEQMSQLQM